MVEETSRAARGVGGTADAFSPNFKAWLKAAVADARALVIITAGGTAVYLGRIGDEEYVLDNFSTGTRSRRLAEAHLKQGHHVIYIHREKTNVPAPSPRLFTIPFFFLKSFFDEVEGVLRLLRSMLYPKRLNDVQSGVRSLRSPGPGEDEVPTEESTSASTPGSHPRSMIDGATPMTTAANASTTAALLEVSDGVSDGVSAGAGEGRGPPTVIIYHAAAVSDFQSSDAFYYGNPAKAEKFVLVLESVPKKLPLFRDLLPEAFSVAFKLETEEKSLIRHALPKLQSRTDGAGADLVLANLLHTRHSHVWLLRRARGVAGEAWKAAEGDPDQKRVQNDQVANEAGGFEICRLEARESADIESQVCREVILMANRQTRQTAEPPCSETTSLMSDQLVWKAVGSDDPDGSIDNAVRQASQVEGNRVRRASVENAGVCGAVWCDNPEAASVIGGWVAKHFSEGRSGEGDALRICLHGLPASSVEIEEKSVRFIETLFSDEKEALCPCADGCVAAAKSADQSVGRFGGESRPIARVLFTRSDPWRPTVPACREKESLASAPDNGHSDRDLVVAYRTFAQLQRSLLYLLDSLKAQTSDSKDLSPFPKVVSCGFERLTASTQLEVPVERRPTEKIPSHGLASERFLIPVAPRPWCDSLSDLWRDSEVTTALSTFERSL